MNLDEYVTKLVCPKCGGTHWKLGMSCILTTYPPIPVQEYICSECGTVVRVKSNPFHAPISKEVFLENGDEVV